MTRFSAMSRTTLIGKLIPVPAPNGLIRVKISRNTSASTHVPMAKCAPRRRKARKAAGIAATPTATAVSGYGSERWNLKKSGGDDETVATKADKRLLPHRDESRISGKQIPGLRKSQVITDLNQEAHFGAASPGRHRKQHTDRDEHNGKPDATGTG